MSHNEKLKLNDGTVGVHIIRNQQLVPAFRTFQLFFHSNDNLLVDGNSANFTAFALGGAGQLACILHVDYVAD